MPKVYGLTVDDQTRCQHYQQEEDIVALKCKTCQRYYPCFLCHQACCDHPFGRWNKEEFDQYAVLCGKCKRELTINQYVHTKSCPNCQAQFNPNCSKHYHVYFND
ncbi:MULTISPECIES: CHY zinc finger protein [Gracilibacillus]|uniref:CHY zinc finger protein n=1 Tax=Gracilibacillus TaxID=74385 RepID=UPI0008265E09|nr:MULTISPECIES: CHY zinc finger protein [Gracilibacillus]